ncbi:hypothetical protein ABZW11_43820 [Nonomuraea sp. NPDC004580]|uniref:hypothetical protein n=1 Tax=Nonomuraea sp. NPDC004580 TaxID=3154552 RepID=UPI0033B115ED
MHAVLQACQLERARRILGSRLTVHPPEDADEVAITVTYQDVEGVRQLLQFAESITVTGPATARARLRELATRTLQHYS